MGNNRDRVIRFRVSEEEYALICKQFKESGCKTMSDYIRRISMEKVIIHYTGKSLESSLEKIAQLIGSVSNNLNQIAKRVNATGRVYEEDIEEMKGKVNDLWQRQLSIQLQLQKLKL